MSWLTNHMRHFVIPGIRTLARADGKVLTDADIKQTDKILRPSNRCEYREAGMIYSLVSSILPKSNTTREVALGLCRQVGKPGDAEFVYELDLGGRGDYTGERVKKLSEGYDDIEGADVLHSFIQNSVKELKARTRKRRTAIYPGRDVWCWEVMSKRQGMPSVYDSRVSRSVAGNQKAVKKLIEPWPVPDWKKTVLFDTGHAGTVPRAIGKAAGLEQMLVIMLSAENNAEQIFRTHAKSRKKALACEYLAKYRRRATVRDDAPYQELAELEEFIKAALLTVWLWYHVSPARLPAWRDEIETEKLAKRKKGSGGLSISSGNSGIFYTPAPTPIYVSGNSTVTGNIILNTSTASGTGSITTTGSTWDLLGTSATTLDTSFGMGTASQLLADQIDQQQQKIAQLEAQLKAQQFQKGKQISPNLDPNTFNLIDPISRAPLDKAMDAKAMGLDPVQYEVQRARQEALDKAKRELTGMRHAAKPINKDFYTKVQLQGPPYGPPTTQHRIDIDKQTGQPVRNTIVSQPLPGYNSPSQPNQVSGGPSGGKAPTPTTGGMRVVQIPAVGPPVTDGNGKAITG